MNTPQALIIEDDRDLSTIFSQALRTAGFEVMTATTHDEALASLTANTPFVITLDLHLQQTRGDDILRYVRAEGRFARSQVILTTADAAWGTDLQDEADYVLIKPISFTQLRDLAARLKAQF